MTRRDFVELAIIVRDTPGTDEDRRRLAKALASLCKRQNRNFDEGRFLAAAGV